MIDMVNFLTENLFNILLILVGLSAFGVYFWQKSDHRRVAATLIQGQIDSIEKHILALKNEQQLGNIAVYNTTQIIHENSWEQYKHLFVKVLNNSEYELVQTFFDNAEKLERSRLEIIETIKTAWRDKSSTQQQIIADIIKNKPEDWQNNVQRFESIYIPLDYVFTPDIVIAALTKCLNNFYPISGTTAYQKIQKKSYK